jgi:hypothetical protein
MAPTNKGMAEQLDELLQYQKRAKFMLAKLHRELDERDATIDRLHNAIAELERLNRELRRSQ